MMHRKKVPNASGKPSINTGILIITTNIIIILYHYLVLLFTFYSAQTSHLPHGYKVLYAWRINQVFYFLYFMVL